MGRSEEARCRVNAAQIIIEIEWLECLFRLPDNRSPEMPYSTAANQGHHERYPDVSGFRLPRLEWLEQLFMLADNRSRLPL
jgi:hypothetical protein